MSVQLAIVVVLACLLTVAALSILLNIIHDDFNPLIWVVTLGRGYVNLDHISEALIARHEIKTLENCNSRGTVLIRAKFELRKIEARMSKATHAQYLVDILELQ